jgi:hypothetical protein
VGLWARYLPGAQPDTVVAQTPPPEAAAGIAQGKSNFAADNGQRYVMPSFVGKPLAEANALIKGGFTLGKVRLGKAEPRH